MILNCQCALQELAPPRCVRLSSPKRQPRCSGSLQFRDYRVIGLFVDIESVALPFLSSEISVSLSRNRAYTGLRIQLLSRH